MESTLNTELLATMLKDKRGNKGLRAIAQEIGGVSFATLSRIEQGRFSYPALLYLFHPL